MFGAQAESRGTSLLQVFSFPYKSCQVCSLTGAGVYLFSSLSEDEIRAQTSGLDFTTVNFSALEILYVGKAKSLRARISCYVRQAGSLQENHKLEALRNQAKSIIILPFATHFEACLQEIFLIRWLGPKLNSISINISRLAFLTMRNNTLLLQAAPPTDLRHMAGFTSSLRWAQDSLGLLASVMAACQQGSSLQKVLTKSFTRRNSVSLFNSDLKSDVKALKSSDSSLCLQQPSEVELFFLGRKPAFLRKIWTGMQEAAASQQFQHAAVLRDIYYELVLFQSTLVASRKIFKKYRNAVFTVESGDENCIFEIKDYDVQGQFAGVGAGAFSLSHELALAGHPRLGAFKRLQHGLRPELRHEPHHALRKDLQLVSRGVKARSYLTSRLRINYEILRLMQRWTATQAEPCRLLKSVE